MDSYEQWQLDASGGLSIIAGAFFQEEVGATSAWVRRPGGTFFSQGGLRGRIPSQETLRSMYLGAGFYMRCY